MTLHLHNTIREALDCLVQGVLVDLHIVHDYVNLRLLINLLPDLHNAISRKLDGVLHVLVHLSLVTDKHDMRDAKYVEYYSFVKGLVKGLSGLNSLAIKDQNLLEMSLLYVALDIDEAAIYSASASPGRREELGPEERVQQEGLP
jgi:hypothetical protein